MTHTYKKTILVLLVSLSITIGKAQKSESNAFTLQQAIDYAYKNSPSYLTADLDAKSAEYKRKEIMGAGLPQITGSIDLKDYIEIPTSLLPGQFFGAPAGSFIPVKFGTKYNATAGLNASQLVFSSDYIFGLKASKTFIELSKINVMRSKADLVSQVSKAYYNVLINKDRVKLLDANIIRLKKIYEDTKAFNVQGFVELIDVERLEVQYNNLKTEKEKVDRLIELSETVLKFQMGYKLDDSITLTDTLVVDTKEAEQLASGKIDISKRPEYQLLMAQQKLLNIDVKRLKWGYSPTLVAYGAYQYNAQRQEFDFLDNSKPWFKIGLIGATLNLNVFDGLQRHNKIQQAKIAALKNEYSLKNIEMASQLEASVASISYTNAYASLISQKRNMDLAQHIYDVVQQKFNQGVGSNIEIVNAEAGLKEAQTNYYNAVYDMLVSKIDYLKSTGALIK